jgi:hypothetical protein
VLKGDFGFMREILADPLEHRLYLERLLKRQRLDVNEWHGFAPTFKQNTKSGGSETIGRRLIK